MTGITNMIERLILEDLVPDSGLTKINPDESLIATGILDSLTLMRLVMMLQERFGVTVEDGELIPDNFETVNRIKTFLEKKRLG